MKKQATARTNARQARSGMGCHKKKCEATAAEAAATSQPVLPVA